MNQLKVQNLYNTLLTQDGGIPPSGDCDFTVATAPTRTYGYIILSPDNALQREIMYYHNVVGNRIYVKGVNRISPREHAEGEVVKMNDVAEIFNTFSDMISQAFYVEKIGGLNVKVWGGYVLYNGNPVVVADTTLTLSDNTTNYIKYDFISNTISVGVSDTGNVKSAITTSLGLINSISYRFHKESFQSLVPGAGDMLASFYDPSSKVKPVAFDDEIVHNTGNESISGVKTFSSSPIVPTPVSGTQASNKDYSDSLNPDFYQYSIVRSVGNLIANNSFETNLSGWAGSSCSITRDTTQSYVGAASMRIDFGAGFGYVDYANTGKVGLDYTLSAYVKGTPGETIDLLVLYQGASSTLTLDGTWQRITFSYKSVNTDNSIQIRSSSGSHSVYVDAVQLEEGTTVAGPFTTTQGNLTVAIKNYLGNDPTPTAPVKIMIGGVVRTITSALSITVTSGINYTNSGSTELATKEIDYFVYLAWNGSTILLTASRLPFALTGADFSDYGFNERGDLGNNLSPYNSTVSVVNIGRFNATLSAGAGYTWSIPSTSVIVNKPINETRWLETANYRYMVQGNNLITQRDYSFTMASGTDYLSVGVTLPMTYSTYSINFGGVDSAAFATSNETVMIHWNAKTASSFNFVAITRAGNVATNRTSTALIQTTGKW